MSAAILYAAGHKLGRHVEQKLGVRAHKYIKGSKERYVLGQNTTCEFSGVIPFIKLQNDT